MFRKLHKSEVIHDWAASVERAGWRVGAVIFEKKLVAEIKKASGISKISAVRRALAEKSTASVPDEFICGPILEYANRIVKK